MPHIIGTAGHIDHGKTSLIKALTGQETDRLKEEQERGISIDLGFAYLDLPNGERAGIVDVPGHERFIRNMLAGAHGIDLVLFTIAADDGVMPQSEEHLDFLHLLGLKRLRQEITTQLQTYERPPLPGYFRLPVDRAFVMKGHGVVITGTAIAGTISEGDSVRVLPGGEETRVRSLQVHGQAVPLAKWGQRVALNLAGLEKSDITRGHMICHPKVTLTTQRFDAFV